MAVYGYARVSTLRQADEGESLAVQNRQIINYAALHGFTLDQVFIERGVSGSTSLSERSEGQLLLKTLKPGDCVITPKLDRMFRSAIDALGILDQFKSQDIGLHMIDLGGNVCGDGISKLMFTILSAVAEAERDRIRERIAQVKSDQKHRGRYLGGKIPFGFELGPNGNLNPIPTQQEVINLVQELRRKKNTFRYIQSFLKNNDINISISTIHRICLDN
ncbi:recombinase family protein [Komagataeibacter sp. FNDCF1]|uniref:recombinase family protein n=1 Tax=Komagataeibacter sp. FNDCF1 TaxID=2878681 RepID=UPI001E362286|nr:recombinase family protein [Komagataeibacter sp. FNDCF1]MCE2566443.1 recombinase family protein [Komagataeibacter sp. FNDCF1]